METNKLDEFNSRALHLLGEEQAPDGFTAAVMQRIAAENEKLVYQPLISRRGWLMIFLCSLAVTTLLWLVFTHSSPQQDFLSKLSIGDFYSSHIQSLLSFVLGALGRYSLYLAGALVVFGLLFLDRVLSAPIRKILASV